METAGKKNNDTHRKNLTITHIKSSFTGPKVPYLCVLGSIFEKRLSYLKSASLNVSYCKVSYKMKILKFGIIFEISAWNLSNSKIL